MQCIISLHSPHAAGKRASMHHVLLAAGVISCFRLLWCVLQLQWKDRYTSVSAVSAPRPRLPGDWGWGAVSRLYLVRPVRWSNHPNISIRLTSSVASGFGQHVMPPPASNADLWPSDLESGMRVASKVGNPSSKFGHTRSLRSGIIRYVRDGRTVRRTDGWTKAALIAPFPMVGGIMKLCRLTKLPCRFELWPQSNVINHYYFKNRRKKL